MTSSCIVKRKQKALTLEECSTFYTAGVAACAMDLPLFHVYCSGRSWMAICRLRTKRKFVSAMVTILFSLFGEAENEIMNECNASAMLVIDSALRKIIKHIDKSFSIRALVFD